MADVELNLHRIAQKVAGIKNSLAVSREYAAQKDEVFLGNPEAIRSARYAFIVLIEAATNIAGHLCARLLPTLAKEQQHDLCLQLDAELSYKLHLPVDVHSLNYAPLPFAYEVLRRGELLICRDRLEYSDFLERISAAYRDFLPLLEISYADLLAP